MLSRDSIFLAFRRAQLKLLSLIVPSNHLAKRSTHNGLLTSIEPLSFQLPASPKLQLNRVAIVQERIERVFTSIHPRTFDRKNALAYGHPSEIQNA